MKINNIIKKLLVVSIPCFITIFTAFSVSATNSIVVHGEIKNEEEIKNGFAISKEDLDNSIILSGVSHKDGTPVKLNLILSKNYNIELDIPSEDVPFLSDEETYSDSYCHCCVSISNYNEQTIQATLEENFGRGGGSNPRGYVFRYGDSRYTYRIDGNDTLGKKILTIYTANKKITSPDGVFHYVLYEKYRVYEINVGIDNVDVKLLKSYWPNKPVPEECKVATQD